MNGPYAGQKVKDAKAPCKKAMIEEGLALEYWEPEQKVVSRYNDECVPAKVEQLYLAYGASEWKSQVKE